MKSTRLEMIFVMIALIAGIAANVNPVFSYGEKRPSQPFGFPYPYPTISPTSSPTIYPTITPPGANVSVYVAGSYVDNYNIPYQSSLGLNYLGLNDGPVKIESKNGAKIVTSERVAY